MEARSEELAEELVDRLVTTEVDWRDLVRAYPRLSLTVAAVAGFALGKARGPAIVAALTAYAADTLASNVNELLGDEVL